MSVSLSHRYSKHIADTTVSRTGYTNIRDDNRKIFGSDVIDRTTIVWGLDKEGELNGSYRPTGYPGVSPVAVL